jgi:hypothetical protein
MSTTTQYQQLLDELAGELTEMERKVFDALKSHPNGLTRPQLVAIVYHEWTSKIVVNNSTKDRMVRKTIESLRAKMVPIVSNSGQAGYRLDVSREARQKMVSELISRRDRLNEQIERAAKFYEIPLAVPVAETARQAALL